MVFFNGQIFAVNYGADGPFWRLPASDSIRCFSSSDCPFIIVSGISFNIVMICLLY